MIVLLVAGVASCERAQDQIPQEDATIRNEDISVVSFERMNYPPLARMANVRGSVVVQVTLDETGRVASASALSGTRWLVHSALSNAKRWVFRPNAGKAVVLVYQFHIRERCVQYKSASTFAFEAPNFVLVTDCAFEAQP
jgi:TonB family protein